MLLFSLAFFFIPIEDVEFSQGFSRTAGPLNLKQKTGAWQDKLTLCEELRSLRGLGPFQAKNCWQFLRLGDAVGAYPDKHNSKYGEVGPGGRKGVNLLRGWPPRLSCSSTDRNAALFYSHQDCSTKFLV